MNTYRCVVWTGPTLVKPFARVLKRAKIRVAQTGTEKLLVDVKGSDAYAASHNMRAALMRKYKRDWGLQATGCTKRPKK